MTEIQWKHIPSFDKRYTISELGEIKSNGKILKCFTRKTTEYVSLSLRKNKDERFIKYYVHRLVALTFIPNPENKKTVNHKNHDRGDNRAVNLEWSTQKEQCNNKKDVKVQQPSRRRPIWKCDPVSGRRLERFQSITDAAQSVLESAKNITAASTSIGHNVNGKSSTSYGYIWKFDTDGEVSYENEIWKIIDPSIIKNIDLGYQISSEGRLRKHDTGRIYNPVKGAHGYMNSSIQSRQFLTHILVAKTFLPNFLAKPIVNHKDGNKENPRLYNLEWFTHSENTQHAHDSGLISTNRKVRQLSKDGKVVAEFKSITDALRKTGAPGISNVCRGVLKTSGGFVWEYADV